MVNQELVEIIAKRIATGGLNPKLINKGVRICS